MPTILVVEDETDVNNLIRDTGGAAVSVSGGYNCLEAYNTCVRVARWNSPIVVGYGARGPGSGAWDATCDDYLKAGGGGAPT